ncbi:MAG TPA: hypothetical protein VGG90_06145 [Candidatus Dormibacteraeota bacterium]|jgi:hypothetical protein
MSEQELMLAQVGQVLSQVARPYRCDETIPADVQASLSQLGLQCDERTPREEVIAHLWARKRTLQVNLECLWGGPGPTSPAAA